MAVLSRSTKAGVRTPATPGRMARSVAAFVAQRRPGCEPRRHPARDGPVRIDPPTLNEGRGANPGDTRCSREAFPVGKRAQRRPGCEPRRHAPVGAVAAPPRPAQRRPGCEPRRHPGPAGCRCPGACRSTKAGVRTPATLSMRSMARCIFWTAQRRPGCEPRRHHRLRHRGWVRVVRSTKAGVRTPATPDPTSDRHRHRRALNEGRGANPGDTRTTRPASCELWSAQRRPGCEPRRHPVLLPAHRSRGIHAQRRPGCEPRRHTRHRVDRRLEIRRSTKAGVRTPATRPMPRI